MASPAFGIATAGPAEATVQAIRRLDPEASLLQYADDTHIHIDPAHLSGARVLMAQAWSQAGLSLHPSKTKVWTPDPAAALGEWADKRVGTLKCLGANLVDDGIAWSQPEHGEAGFAELDKAITKLEAYGQRLCELRGSGLSVQLAQALFRYAAVGGPQHILMCRAIPADSAGGFDARLRAVWERILGITFSDDAWATATLPMKLGGIAPGAIAPRASAAYLSAVARTLPEVLRRTGLPSDSALRGAVGALDARIKSAAADLVGRGIDEAEIPFAEGISLRVPKQKDLVSKVHRVQYKERLALLADPGKAQLRSASGTGAAAFLMLPTQQNHHVEDTLFQVAVVRRLGGRVTPKGGWMAPRCALVNAGGRCEGCLDTTGIHANQCKRGGHIVRRHDRIVKWLAGWIGERVDTETLVEQCPPGSEGGESRLDITFESDGRRLWLDVAVVTVLTLSEPDVIRRARMDGAAARQEENSKKSKYKGLATPFVIESLGRPGDIARSVLGRFATDQGQGASADVAAA